MKKLNARSYIHFSAILLFCLFLLPGCFEEAPILEGPFPVVRVVDGDTILVEMDSKEERVRFIGIDTPESVHPDPAKNVPYGKIASDYTKNLLEGEEVYLEFDVSERDRYGRILAYVYLEDKMINEMLLEEGHARIATYPPNIKYEERFYRLQKEARENKKGGWKSDVFI